MMTLKHVLETDVLVVGGGIGGLCAAISAAQGGARVTVRQQQAQRFRRDRQRSFHLLLSQGARQ